MRSFGLRALGAVGFSVLFALTAACGGGQPEAKAPTTDSADALRVGSPTPDPASGEASASTTPDAPKPAVVSADNGSDIIPPFSASKEPAVAPKKSGKGSSKKTAGKSKKKPAAS